MHQSKELTASVSARHAEVDSSMVSDLTPIAIVARGKETTGLSILQRTTDDITPNAGAFLLLHLHRQGDVR
jgi:hypothetical protein